MSTTETSEDFSSDSELDIDVDDIREMSLALISGIQDCARSAMENQLTGWVRAQAKFLGMFLSAGLLVTEGQVKYDFKNVEVKKDAAKAIKSKDGKKSLQKLQKTLGSTMDQIEAAAVLMDEKGLDGIVGGAVDYSFLGTGLEFIFEFDLGSVLAAAKRRDKLPTPSATTAHVVESMTSALARTAQELQKKEWEGTARSYGTLGGHTLMMGAHVRKPKGWREKRKAKKSLVEEVDLPPEFQSLVGFYEGSFRMIEQAVNQVHVGGLAGKIGGSMSIHIPGLGGIKFLMLVDIHSVLVAMGLAEEPRGFFRNPFHKAPTPKELPPPQTKAEKKADKATNQAAQKALEVLQETKDILSARKWRGTIRSTFKMIGFGLVVWVVIAEKDFEDQPRRIHPDTDTYEGKMLKGALTAMESAAPFLEGSTGGLVGGGVDASALGTGFELGLEVEISSVMASIEMVHD